MVSWLHWFSMAHYYYYYWLTFIESSLYGKNHVKYLTETNPFYPSTCLVGSAVLVNEL